MRCFSCIDKKRRFAFEDEGLFDSYSSDQSSGSSDGRRLSNFGEIRRGSVCLDDTQNLVDRIKSSAAQTFSFRELAVATKNFKESNLIGEGGFGKVYKGRLEDGQAIAAKRLNLDGLQGNQEFIVEVLMLSLLHHPNLVTLIGYCAEGDQRLLVYEYMSRGNLADHLFEIEHERDVLDWNTRVKIAAGAARGLEYLHCKANPPVIYRDIKSANILLDDDFNPKLSDFGLAKLAPVGDKTHVSTRVMGTYGYCAPEYAMSGKLTSRSDIYSFGVVLLELVTGRRAYDITKRNGTHSLVAWSHPYLKDRKKYLELVDPRLKGRYPPRSAKQLIHVVALCLKEEPGHRPPVSDIVAALDYLVNEIHESPYSSSSTYTPTSSSPSSLLQSQGNPFSPNQHYK